MVVTNDSNDTQKSTEAGHTSCTNEGCKLTDLRCSVGVQLPHLTFGTCKAKKNSFTMVWKEVYPMAVEKDSEFALGCNCVLS